MLRICTGLEQILESGMENRFMLLQDRVLEIQGGLEERNDGLSPTL